MLKHDFLEPELSAAKKIEDALAAHIARDVAFQEWAGVKTARKAARRVVRGAGGMRAHGRWALVKCEDYEMAGGVGDGFERHLATLRVFFVDFHPMGSSEEAGMALWRVSRGVMGDIPPECHYDGPVTEPLEAEGDNGHGVSVLRCVVFHDDWVPAVSSFVGANPAS